MRAKPKEKNEICPLNFKHYAVNCDVSFSYFNMDFDMVFNMPNILIIQHTLKIWHSFQHVLQFLTHAEIFNVLFQHSFLNIL